MTRTQVTPEAFRKNLQRARAKFIELLVQELRETIHPTSTEDVEAEIFDLGLGHLYRRYSSLVRPTEPASRDRGPLIRPGPGPGICDRRAICTNSFGVRAFRESMKFPRSP